MVDQWKKFETDVDWLRKRRQTRVHTRQSQWKLMLKSWRRYVDATWCPSHDIEMSWFEHGSEEHRYWSHSIKSIVFCHKDYPDWKSYIDQKRYGNTNTNSVLNIASLLGKPEWLNYSIIYVYDGKYAYDDVCDRYSNANPPVVIFSKDFLEFTYTSSHYDCDKRTGVSPQ